MKYYPVFLDIKGKNCLVVGGGAVGARKAATLGKAGGCVTVISPLVSEKLDKVIKKADGSIQVKKKEYESSDINGMTLVFAATDNARINSQVSKDASQLNILCNVADAPANSNFILPAVVEQGDLLLAVSTCGNSPALAKQIKKKLQTEFGPEYKTVLQVMGRIREKLLSQGHDPDQHKKVFYSLIEQGIIDLIRDEDEKKINQILGQLLGNDVVYKDLVS